MGKRRQDDPPHLQGHGPRVGDTSPRHGIVHHQAPGYKHSVVMKSGVFMYLIGYTWCILAGWQTRVSHYTRMGLGNL